MDLFNKKKIKKLEENLKDIREHRDYYEKLYVGQVEHTNDLIKNNSYLREENSKLIDWIMNILDAFGTMEVRDGRSVQIPVCKEIEQVNFNNDIYGLHEREIITIPEIRIVKMG